MKLSSYCEMIVDCEHKTAPTQATGYPSIRTPNIGRGYFILDGVNRVSREIYEAWTKRAIPQPGDLIMAREAPVGNVAMVPEGLQPCLGQRTLLIRPDKSKVHPAYLVYLLIGPEVQSVIHARTNGVTVPHLNMKDVRDLELPALPDLDEQRCIASILSAYDDLIENCERRIRVLDEMARALYREWFVDLRFPGGGVPAALSGDLLPQGWTVSSVGDVAVNHDRLRRPLSKVQRAARPGIYPYYGAAKVFDYIDGYIFDGQYLLLAEDGSVSTPEGLPVLQLTSGKFWANNHTHVLQGKPPVSTYFLYLALSSLSVSAYVTGAAQPKITQENMNRMPVVCGPAELHEQFDAITLPMLSHVQLIELEVALLRQTRDLLLPRLLSGQLSVGDAA